MKRENRYIVIKRKDLAPNVPLDTLEEFEEVFSKVFPLLPARECVVVESDWPEYEHVWELIRLRVEKAQIPAETVQGVVDAPAVDAALRSFTDDATNDNAFFLVRAIMEACLPRTPAPEIAGPDWSQAECRDCAGCGAERVATLHNGNGDPLCEDCYPK